MENVKTLRTKTLWATLAIFGVSFALIYLSLYVIIPLTVQKGMNFGYSYLIFFYYPFALLLITALVLIKAEAKGRKLTWAMFKNRYRLNKFDRTTVLWTTGLFVFWFVLLIFIEPAVGKALAKIPFFAPNTCFPPEINPNVPPAAPGVMFGMALHGKWWIPLIYFAGWFFNIFGEELLFRGYLLPKQEAAFGKYAWLIQGSFWGLWHFFWKWNFPVLFITCLALSFVAQKTKNTWVGIIVHGSLNFVPLIMIIISVIK